MKGCCWGIFQVLEVIYFRYTASSFIFVIFGADNIGLVANVSLGSHSREYEAFFLLYSDDAVQSHRCLLTFRRYIPSPASGYRLINDLAC
jgi:hypothetical protein